MRMINVNVTSSKSGRFLKSQLLCCMTS